MSLYEYGLYPGDSPGKAEVRRELYTRSALAWEKTGRPGGAAVTLAGPEALEIPYLRDYLGWAPEKTWFVDKRGSGLGLVRHHWPSARTYHGELHHALKLVDSIGFLNLDFMGSFNDSVEASLLAARGKILDNAIVSYTFYRCRENPVHHSYQRVLESARHWLTPDELRDKNRVRWVGNALRLQETLGVDAEPILLTPYRSSFSPMGVIAFQANTVA